MKRITVTDLTRFSKRDIVCLAGIDDDGNCVRPLVRGTERGYPSFDVVSKLKVLPGTILEGDFEHRKNAVAPHTEDHSYDGQLKVVGEADSDTFKEILETAAVDTFQEGFGFNPTGKLFLSSNKPPAVSIITLRVANPRRSLKVVVDNYGKLRIHVTDASGHQLSFLSVTDLGFADHLEALRSEDPSLNQLNADLQAEAELYLRVGLAREYTDAAGRSGYWIQVNGIYTFPNYRTDLRRYD